MPDEMYQLLRQIQQTNEAREAAAEKSMERFEALCDLSDHTLLAMIAWLLERQTAMLADRLDQPNVELDVEEMPQRRIPE